MEKYIPADTREGELIIEELPEDLEYISINLTTELPYEEAVDMALDILSCAEKYTKLLVVAEHNQDNRLALLAQTVTAEMPLYSCTFKTVRCLEHVWSPTTPGLDSLLVTWVQRSHAILFSCSALPRHLPGWKGPRKYNNFRNTGGRREPNRPTYSKEPRPKRSRHKPDRVAMISADKSFIEKTDDQTRILKNVTGLLRRPALNVSLDAPPSPAPCHKNQSYTANNGETGAYVSDGMNSYLRDNEESKTFPRRTSKKHQETKLRTSSSITFSERETVEQANLKDSGPSMKETNSDVKFTLTSENLACHNDNLKVTPRLNQSLKSNGNNKNDGYQNTKLAAACSNATSDGNDQQPSAIVKLGNGSAKSSNFPSNKHSDDAGDTVFVSNKLNNLSITEICKPLPYKKISTVVQPNDTKGRDNLPTENDGDYSSDTKASILSLNASNSDVVNDSSNVKKSVEGTLIKSNKVSSNNDFVSRTADSTPVHKNNSVVSSPSPSNNNVNKASFSACNNNNNNAKASSPSACDNRKASLSSLCNNSNASARSNSNIASSSDVSNNKTELSVCNNKVSSSSTCNNNHNESSLLASNDSKTKSSPKNNLNNANSSSKNNRDDIKFSSKNNGNNIESSSKSSKRRQKRLPQGSSEDSRLLLDCGS